MQENGEAGKNVAQPSPAVNIAASGKAAYRRDLPHFQPEGKTFSITFVTKDRWVLPESARHEVMRCILFAKNVRFDLHAAVVMPDHVHLLITPNRDNEGDTFPLSQILGGIKGAAAHAVNSALSRTGPVWQAESFDHVLRRDENKRATAEYICTNPMRAGLVEHEGDYSWLWREWIEGAGDGSDP